MYVANLQQVFKIDPERKAPFSSWILLLCQRTETEKENIIRSKHPDIEPELRSQSVNYTEITAPAGKHLVYEKFGCKARKHPLFLVLKTHPLNYNKGDPFMLIEWGKWNDADSLREDLMSFVTFFSDEDFRKSIANAQDTALWKKFSKYLEKNGLGFLGIGTSILVALF